MRLGSEVDIMNLNKDIEEGIFKSFANTTTLKCYFKAQRRGAWLYLPEFLVNILGIKREEDSNLLVVVVDDPDSSYRFLVLLQDRFVINKLRPILLNTKYQLEEKLKKAKELAESTETSTVAPDLQDNIEMR